MFQFEEAPGEEAPPPESENLDPINPVENTLSQRWHQSGYFRLRRLFCVVRAHCQVRMPRHSRGICR
jgi:hypothetical protein